MVLEIYMKIKTLLFILSYLMLLASCSKEIEAEDINEKKDKKIDYEISSSIEFKSGIIYDLKEIIYKDGTVKSFFKVDDKIVFDQEYLKTQLPLFPKELSEMMKLIDENKAIGNDEDAHSAFTMKNKIVFFAYEKMQQSSLP
jgi:hypothetical protein